VSVLLKHKTLEPERVCAALCLFLVLGVTSRTAFAGPTRCENVSVIASGWVSMEPIRAAVRNGRLSVLLMIHSDPRFHHDKWSGAIAVESDDNVIAQFSETAEGSERVNLTLQLPPTRMIKVKLLTPGYPVTSYFSVCTNRSKKMITKWRTMVGLRVN